MFQSDPESNTSEGIFGISLKEEKAQAGAATSFKNILTRKDNIDKEKSEKIENRDILSVIYHIKNFKEKYKSGKKDELSSNAFYFSNLGFGYASCISVKERMAGSPKIVKAGNDAMKFIESVLTSTLGKNLPEKKGGKYSIKALQIAFLKNPPKTFEAPSNIDQILDSLADATSEVAVKEFTRLQAKFKKDLKASGYKVPKDMTTPEEMRDKNSTSNFMSRILAKAGCYKLASEVLNGMSSGLLKIPKEFITIAKQKNVFVAMTAFGVGMAGLSPTFFKIIGSSSGNAAHMDPIYGNGFFHLDDNSEVVVEDKPTTAGFNISFIAKVTKNSNANSRALKRYSVTMVYHSAGDQISVLVQQLNPFKK